MISIWEEKQKQEYPIETGKRLPPPWLAVPAGAAGVALGSYHGAKHVGKKLVAKPFKKVGDMEPMRSLKKVFKALKPGNVEEALAVGLLNEMTKRSVSSIYKGAARRALLKGQKRMIANPADRVGRGLVDGGNSLLSRATQNKVKLRTVS